jgi:hypothetical protein
MQNIKTMTYQTTMVPPLQMIVAPQQQTSNRTIQQTASSEAFIRQNPVYFDKATHVNTSKVRIFLSEYPRRFRGTIVQQDESTLHYPLLHLIKLHSLVLGTRQVLKFGYLL